jgi:glycine hydroxymethyltransferase
MITVGLRLNLTHHPVAAIRAIADEVGAKVLFDAAHLSGVIAGKPWPNQLSEGAHVMTCSTYKSPGGSPSGLLVTSDMSIDERVARVRFADRRRSPTGQTSPRGQPAR